MRGFCECRELCKNERIIGVGDFLGGWWLADCPIFEFIIFLMVGDAGCFDYIFPISWK
jgi:hypothetical protein